VDGSWRLPGMLCNNMHALIGTTNIVMTTVVANSWKGVAHLGVQCSDDCVARAAPGACREEDGGGGGGRCPGSGQMHRV